MFRGLVPTFAREMPGKLTLCKFFSEAFLMNDRISQDIFVFLVGMSSVDMF